MRLIRRGSSRRSQHSLQGKPLSRPSGIRRLRLLWRLEQGQRTLQAFVDVRRQAATDPERHSATFGSSSSRATSSVATRDPTQASNSNSLRDVGEVKFQSRPAVCHRKGPRSGLGDRRHSAAKLEGQQPVSLEPTLQRLKDALKPRFPQGRSEFAFARQRVGVRSGVRLLSTTGSSG